MVILLDQEAIPLVTTEDRNEILLEPTWNSTEEKAARKKKRKDGKTDVEKAEEEAKRVAKAAAKTAERDRKRAEKVAEEEAKRAAKAAAKTAECDRKRAEKEQEEQARQQKKEQEEHARKRKKEQEVQAPKMRGKYMTFEDRMEDLKRFKETHGHVNVSLPEDKSLGQFCANVRYARKNPGKGVKLTGERIAAFDAIDFNWTSQEYVTRSFDERIEDLHQYKQTHGHVNVKKHEDDNLYQFIVGVRHSLNKVEKDGTRKLTEERIARLDDIGFKW